MQQPDFLSGWEWDEDISAFTSPQKTEDGLYLGGDGGLWNVETITRSDGKSRSYATLIQEEIQ